MDMIEDVLELLTKNAIALGILGTAIAGLFNFLQFVKVRKAELRQKEFENYHSLIDRLNVPQQNSGCPLLDMQKSAVFELRNYPAYKDVTHNILSGWIKRGATMDGIVEDTLRVLGVPYNSDV